MKKLFPIFAFATFVIAVILSFVLLRDFEVDISETQVQNAIQAQIENGPIESRGVLLTINSGSVDFRDNNTALLSVDFEAEGLGYSGGVIGEFTSGLRYDSPKIYLSDLEPIQVETNFDSATQQKIDDLTNIAKDFLNRQKEEASSDEVRDSLDRVLGDSESKLKDMAVSTTYAFFETVPIYDLTSAGYKGSLASLALKDVRFEADRAVVVLSPIQAIIKILIGIGIILLIGLYFWATYFELIGAPWNKKKKVKAASEEKS